LFGIDGIRAELPVFVIDTGQSESAVEDSAGQGQLDSVLRLMQNFICAVIGYADAATAFVYGAFISEEFHRVVEDFYGAGGVLGELKRGFIKAIGLQS